MKVCIAEKPSVAADLAKVLGADRRRDGFYEGPEYCVTWTFGHLCTLKEPHDYLDADAMCSALAGHYGIGAARIAPRMTAPRRRFTTSVL